MSKFFRNASASEKILLHDFFHSTSLTQYGLTLHIFSIMLYLQFADNTIINTTSEKIIFCAIPAFIILGVGVYQFYKTKLDTDKLNREEWIPIVTERGTVTGKIAKSVSLSMKNQYLHPVMRIALISGSKIYLQERPMNDLLNPGKLDYPFEKYLLFEEEISKAEESCIKQKIKEDIGITTKFVLKYIFENDNTKRLILLYSAHIDDENKIKKDDKMTGKFWTIKQIEEGFADEIFSECFELEFEYLKNMVLLQSDDQLLANKA